MRCYDPLDAIISFCYLIVIIGSEKCLLNYLVEWFQERCFNIVAVLNA